MRNAEQPPPLSPPPAAPDDDEWPEVPVHPAPAPQPHVDEVPDPLISLQSSTAAPGVLHIAHTAAKSVLKAVPVLDNATSPLTEVCNLIRGSGTKLRLKEKCFNGPAGQQ